MNKDFDLMNNNKVTVLGNVTKMPIFSHEMYGENFYEFEVEVPRLSLSSDLEDFIYRSLLTLKMLVNTPSLCAVFFLVVHILCMLNNKCWWLMVMLQPAETESEDVFDKNKKTINQFFAQKNYSYLENMRLLF